MELRQALAYEALLARLRSELCWEKAKRRSTRFCSIEVNDKGFLMLFGSFWLVKLFEFEGAAKELRRGASFSALHGHPEALETLRGSYGAWLNETPQRTVLTIFLSFFFYFKVYSSLSIYNLTCLKSLKRSIL